MTDVLITGANGQLGRAVTAQALSRGLSVAGSDLDTLDITDASAVERWVEENDPRILVNCAAFTAVDDCETHEEEAQRINGAAVGLLAESCRRKGSLLIQVSTDYVFDGTATTPYREEDPVAPTSAYGRTKLVGEREAQKAPRHLVVRTAWLYGLGGKNFVEAIRRQVESGTDRLRVVADQHGCPTFCDDLAAALLDLAATDFTGIVHAVNSGETTWHTFAGEIVRLVGASTAVDPVTSEAFPRPAPRPAYSVLNTSRLNTLLGRSMPSWQDALGRYLARTSHQGSSRKAQDAVKSSDLAR